jgi:mycoredoxin
MPSTPSPVTVFWRPGCPYCIRLRARLHRAGIRAEEINIWEDSDGAAFVRSVAGGDETVPTVRLWGESMVNPSPRVIVDEIRRRAPELIGTQPELRRSSSRLLAVQRVVIALVLLTSLVAEGLGQSSLSLLIATVALAAYFVIRVLRRCRGTDRFVGRASE